MTPQEEAGLMRGLMAHPGWAVLEKRLQEWAEGEWAAAARPGQASHDMSLHVGAAGAYRQAAVLPKTLVQMEEMAKNQEKLRAAAGGAVLGYGQEQRRVDAP